MTPIAVYLVLLLILLHRATSDPPDTEKKALLSFIQKVTHDASYNWIESKSPCSWKGVFCDPTNTTVIQLSLPQAKLTGEIPNKTISELSNLYVLSLRDNSLNGSIPSDFGFLALNELYLQNNRFSGYLPNINSDYLEKLDVSNNELNCSIPSSLSEFPESAFTGNTNLCGRPLPYCNWSEVSCPFRYSTSKFSSSTLTEHVVLGVAAGVVFLLLLYCLRRMIHQQNKQPVKSSLEAPAAVPGGDTQPDEARNKFVLFDDGNNGFDSDDLFQGSAQFLGRGSVGTSYKRVMEAKTITVVVKRLNYVVVTMTEFESQMELLGKMNHANVVPVRGYYYSKDEKWIVSDYIPAGSLYAHLHGSSETRLDWNQRMRIALSAARGVAYLHAGNVVHGNIKSSNVLLKEETSKDVVVSDYGLYTFFDTWSSKSHWFRGYWAPEVLKTLKFSMESDVYSFGVLLLELLTGKAPNQASNDLGVQLILCEEPTVEIFYVELRKDENMEAMFKMLRIAKCCASIVPNQRPTMQKVVSMMEEMNVVETIILS